MKYYHVDSFTNKLFKGNPAGVCILGETWLDDALMQNIAFENNLSETAFVVCKNGRRHIRWFTPTVEVDLCGHATLAAAHVIFNHLNFEGKELVFDSRKGELRVYNEGHRITLDFPTDVLEKAKLTEEIDCFDIKPVEVYKNYADYVFIYEKEEDIANISFDLIKLSKIDLDGIIITAPGNKTDFVSRYFIPKVGIDEDPVTGYAHTLITPYWQNRMKKDKFTAAQISPRSGFLDLEIRNDRIRISGQAVTYFEGELFLDGEQQPL